MKKRGIQAQLWIIVEIALWALVFVMFWSKVADVKNDTQFEKIFLTRDLALMEETVSNMPGDVIYTYQTKANLSKYQINFDDEARIRDIGQELTYGYPFYFDNHYSTNFQVLKKPKQIMFGKLGGLLKINENLSDEPIQEICPIVDTKGDIQTVMLDHQTDDFAYTLTRSLQLKLMTDPKIISTLTRGKEPTLIEDRIDKINLDTDLVLSIYPGIADGDRNPVVAYYSVNEKSRKMACLMINGIMKEFTDVEINMVPSTEPLLSKNTNGIAVKLVIGNQNIKDNPLYTDTSTMTTVLYSGMREYND